MSTPSSLNTDTSIPTATLIEKRPKKAISGKMDDYDWLRVENWQQVMKTPDVLDKDVYDILTQENAYTDTYMENTKALQDTIFSEIKGRIKEDESSLPSPDGIYEYYSRFEIGAQYPVSCRKKRYENSPVEEILFDFGAMGKDYEYFGIGGICRSHSHMVMAYGLDVKGSEYYTVRFKDTKTGQDLSDILHNTTGGVVWAKGDDYVFYTTLNENHRTDKVWRHKMGTAQSQDICIYTESDSGFFIGVSMTESEEYIMIDSHDHITSESHIIKADAPLSDFICFLPRQIGVEYDISHHGDCFYITTNADDAVDFKVMQTPVKAFSLDNWTEFLPHRPGILLSGISVCESYLLRMEKENALPRIVIYDFATQQENCIEFAEEAYSLGLSGALEYKDTVMRFSYSSPTTPSQIYDYNMATDTRVLRKTQEIPSGHNSEDYVTKRIFATSEDGVKIPVTLVHKKGLQLDGTNPCMLYGYGSYGHSMPAGFSVSRLSLLDRGFVYATAHIRGGMDCGYNWYTQGKTTQKKNTFIDFIACGQALIDNKYTGLGNISAMGGSAGGMLMGAVLNMRPDMFKSVLALVPFVDVLNTICDDTLPLTPPEWNEWGNPLTDKDAYAYIESYSPYDNVTTGSYPHIYIQGGLTDPRVTYWEPAKWLAKLREHKTNADTALVMRMNMGAGHGGASGRFDSLKETAEQFAFVLKSHTI